MTDDSDRDSSKGGAFQSIMVLTRTERPSGEGCPDHG